MKPGWGVSHRAEIAEVVAWFADESGAKLFALTVSVMTRFPTYVWDMVDCELVSVYQNGRHFDLLNG